VFDAEWVPANKNVFIAHLPDLAGEMFAMPTSTRSQSTVMGMGSREERWLKLIWHS
jgi:hypothetical protein